MTVYYQVLRIFWLTDFHCFVIMSLTPCRCGVKSHFLLLVGGYIGKYIGEESLPLFSLFLTLWGNFCGEKPGSMRKQCNGFAAGNFPRLRVLEI